jgi:hypothetical protein
LTRHEVVFTVFHGRVINMLKDQFPGNLNQMGKRDFAIAMLLPHAAAAAAALLWQSAVVVLAAHIELLGITVISGFKGVGALYCT